MSSTLTDQARCMSIPADSDATMFAGSTVTTQVFRLKAEVGGEKLEVRGGKLEGVGNVGG